VERSRQPSRRRSFEDLVRKVSELFSNGRSKELTIGQMADELGEHPWRIVDAIDAIYMLGWR